MVVASAFSATTTKAMVGERLKKARDALGLTQKELCALIGMPLPSLSSYELYKRIPGGDAIAGFIQAGINANWLLIGDGPMLLKDLQRPIVTQTYPGINVDALEAIIEGTLKIARNAPASQVAAHCAKLYQQCLDDGLITLDGVGEGNLEESA